MSRLSANCPFRSHGPSPIASEIIVGMARPSRAKRSAARGSS